MSISFRNTPFKLGTHPAFFATTASMSEAVGYQRVEGLGYSDVGMARNTRKSGTFSADFYLRTGDWTFLRNLAGLVSFSGSIGNCTFTSAYMTEISLSIEPMALVKASVRGIFFGAANWSSGGSTVGLVGTPDSQFAHGASADVHGISQALSVSYSLSQSITAKYILGDEDPPADGYKYDGGEIKITVQGTGIQNAVSLCGNYVDFSVGISSLCGGTVAAVSEDDLKVVNSAISVNAGEDLVGSMELQKFI